MTAELKQLKDQPYDLLVAMDRLLEAKSQERGFGSASNEWTGLGFRLREHWYLAPRPDVREVLPPPDFTRVPGSKPWLLGVANVRGDLLPIIDLGLLLGQGEIQASDTLRVVVLNDEEVPAGFLVDDVAGFRGFTPADQHHELVDAMDGHDPDRSPYLGAFSKVGVDWTVFSLRRLAGSSDFRDAGV
ncbi:MAG: chemotaxis protein CheW [Salinisphaeraceae bacterium]|nr:chemotaxis protein CheW [Salinisphaeraceae bacterium]